MTGRSRNNSGAVAFILLATITVVFDVIEMTSNPKWNTHVPVIVMRNMSALMEYVVPIVFLLTAVAVYHALMGSRLGYVLIAVAGAVEGIWNLFPTIWRVEAGSWGGGFICVVQVIMAILAIRYSVGALAEPRDAEERLPVPTHAGSAH
jgi:hypothetical protein